MAMTTSIQQHAQKASHIHTHTKTLRRDAPHRVASRTSKSRLSALHNDHHQPPRPFACANHLYSTTAMTEQQQQHQSSSLSFHNYLSFPPLSLIRTSHQKQSYHPPRPVLPH
ncbi:uncharacterized protein TrAtP1_010774 [Trichoderma atroviride]|uniref:uncharacterized protein n=1 Tax=Hypocrea atroviridis TaxID=63577 RepID=UPI00331B876C|nr:hypothetical protein TrAtP1_010774 [Trichoderma atroviride]